MAFGGRYPQKGAELFPSPGNPTKVTVRGVDPQTTVGAAALKEAMPFAQSFYIRQSHNFSLSASSYQKTSAVNVTGDRVTVAFNGADTIVLMDVAPRSSYAPTIELETPAVWIFDALSSSGDVLSPDYRPQIVRAVGSYASGSGTWVKASAPWPSGGFGTVGTYGGCVAPNGIDAVSWNQDSLNNPPEGFVEGAIYSKGVQIADMTWADAVIDRGSGSTIEMVSVMFGRVFVYAWDGLYGTVLGSFDLAPEEGVINQNVDIHSNVTITGTGLDGTEFNYLISRSVSPDGMRMVAVWAGEGVVDIAITPTTTPGGPPTVSLVTTPQISTPITPATTVTVGLKHTWSAYVDEVNETRTHTSVNGTYTHTDASYAQVFNYAPLWTPGTGHAFTWIQLRTEGVGGTITYTADSLSVQGVASQSYSNSSYSRTPTTQAAYIVFPGGGEVRVFSSVYGVDVDTKEYAAVGPHMQDGHRTVGREYTLNGDGSGEAAFRVYNRWVNDLPGEENIDYDDPDPVESDMPQNFNYYSLLEYNSQNVTARQYGCVFTCGSDSANVNPQPEHQGLYTAAFDGADAVVDMGAVIVDGSDGEYGADITGDWFSKYIVPW